jgi:hypothetical protein
MYSTKPGHRAKNIQRERVGHVELPAQHLPALAGPLSPITTTPLARSELQARGGGIVAGFAPPKREVADAARRDHECVIRAVDRRPPGCSQGWC